MPEIIVRMEPSARRNEAFKVGSYEYRFPNFEDHQPAITKVYGIAAESHKVDRLGWALNQAVRTDIFGDDYHYPEIQMSCHVGENPIVRAALGLDTADSISTVAAPFPIIRVARLNDFQRLRGDGVNAAGGLVWLSYQTFLKAASHEQVYVLTIY